MTAGPLDLHAAHPISIMALSAGFSGPQALLGPPCPPGLQDSSGISREEMAAALMEVSEGRIPADRIALRELCKEMSQWPALDEPASKRFAWACGLAPACC